MTLGHPATPEACRKALFVWLYCTGLLSFEGCESAFMAHLEWRSA